MTKEDIKNSLSELEARIGSQDKLGTLLNELYELRINKKGMVAALTIRTSMENILGLTRTGSHVDDEGNLGIVTAYLNSLIVLISQLTTSLEDERVDISSFEELLSYTVRFRNRIEYDTDEE